MSASFVLVASIALARPVTAQAAPRYGALPVAELTRPPSRAFPSSVPARETIADFRVDPVRHGASGQSILVLRSARPAATPARSALCMSATPAVHLRASPGADARWPSASGDALWMAAAPNRAFDVWVVHAERLVRAAGRAALESIDAFYDVRTGGARLIERASVPLALVGASHGIEVYAMRERGGTVQFVVAPPSAPAVSTSLDAAPNDDAANLSCTPARFAVDAPTGSGSTVAMTAEVVVDREERRTRPMAVAFGVSRTTRDAEPVLSISFGWGSPR